MPQEYYGNDTLEVVKFKQKNNTVKWSEECIGVIEDAQNWKLVNKEISADSF